VQALSNLILPRHIRVNGPPANSHPKTGQVAAAMRYSMTETAAT